jgi:hypothetical protein
MIGETLKGALGKHAAGRGTERRMADTDNEAAAAPPVAAVAAREEAEHAKAHSAQSGTDSATPILPGVIALILAVLSAVALWFVS